MTETPEANEHPEAPAEDGATADRRLRFERLLAEALVEDRELLDRLAT
ncbi:hypothetical protein [Glycomyces sambucus]|nr:hypothetical protein [Glycomyces sambucus]